VGRVAVLPVGLLPTVDMEKLSSSFGPTCPGPRTVDMSSSPTEAPL